MAKETIQHNDKLSQPLAEGDCVAYPEHNSLAIGTIIKINPKMVKIQRVGSTGYWARGTNKYPNDVVKLDGADVTLYLLKHTK
jgi:hypothetical protein